jgi:hypothetical protein
MLKCIIHNHSQPNQFHKCKEQDVQGAIGAIARLWICDDDHGKDEDVEDDDGCANYDGRLNGQKVKMFICNLSAVGVPVDKRQ